jgi:hypothetical protein
MESLEYRQAVADYLADGRRRGLRPANIGYYAFALGRVGDAAGFVTVQDIGIAPTRPAWRSHVAARRPRAAVSRERPAVACRAFLHRHRLGLRACE